MRVKPGTTHPIWEEWGDTPLGPLGVKLSASDGSDAVARVEGFAEDETGSGVMLLEEFTFPDTGGDYFLIFDDNNGDYSDPARVSTRAVTVTSSAPDGDFDGTTYADVEELYPILKIRTPTEAQEAKANRVMLAAAGEVVRELDLADDQALDGYGVAMAAQVNLSRAAELWKEEEVQFGLMLSEVSGAAYIARDTWEKHAIKLATLKGQWGFA